MPSAAASSAARTARSIDSRSTPGSEAHRLGDVAAVADEDRPDQVGGAQPGLGDEVADPGGAAQPARAGRAGRGRAGSCGAPRGGSARVWHAGGAAPQGRSAFTMPRRRGLTPAARLRPGRGAPVRRPVGSRPLFQTFAAASFQSIWYWVLHVVVWTLACYRTLGVPHDMLLRARRLPEVAARVDTLAQLTSERVGGIHDALGVPIAAVAGLRARRALRARLRHRHRDGAGRLRDRAAARRHQLLEAPAGACRAAAAASPGRGWCWRWRGGGSGTS